MNYNYQKISGSSCASYESTSGTGDAQKMKWRVDWDIAQDSNADLVKGYEFVGLTQNLETRLSEIASIPAEWKWVRSILQSVDGEFVGLPLIHTEYGVGCSPSTPYSILALRNDNEITGIY